MNIQFMSYSLKKTANKKQSWGIHYKPTANTDKNGYHNIRSVLKKARKVYSTGAILEYRPFQATTLPEEPVRFETYSEFKHWLKRQYDLCRAFAPNPTSYYVGVPVTLRSMSTMSTSRADLYIVSP